jgi:hypothetical protein
MFDELMSVEVVGIEERQERANAGPGLSLLLRYRALGDSPECGLPRGHTECGTGGRCYGPRS